MEYRNHGNDFRDPMRRRHDAAAPRAAWNAALAVAMLLMAACSDEHGRHDAPAAPPVAVTLYTVTPQAIPETYATTGTLVANERVEIASRVLGEIRSLAVREGQTVSSGQTLVTLDATEITNRLNEAQARLAEARALEMEARADFERHRKLLTQNAISERAVEQARLRHDVAHEGVRAAEATVSQVRAQIDYTEIRSPVSGIVVARHKRSGDIATPGAPILTLEDPSNIEVETFVHERYINRIQPDDPVSIRIDATGKQSAGTVTRVVRSGDPGTYRYLVKVVLRDTNGAQPGMFARIEFATGEKSGIALPAGAVVERSDLPGVYVIDSDNIARFRMVRTGRQWSDRIEIIAGLNAGDRVAMSNVAMLRTGDRVAVPAADTAASPAADRDE